MRPDEIPEATLVKAFDTLVGVFGGSGKHSRSGWIWALQAATRGWTEEEFRVAVRTASAHCRYFPRPKDLTDHRPTPDRAEAPEAWDPDRCPQCGSGYYPAGFLCVDGEVRERMRCACPHPSQRWCQMPEAA